MFSVLRSDPSVHTLTFWEKGMIISSQHHQCNRSQALSCTHSSDTWSRFGQRWPDSRSLPDDVQSHRRVTRRRQVGGLSKSAERGSTVFGEIKSTKMARRQMSSQAGFYCRFICWPRKIPAVTPGVYTVCSVWETPCQKLHGNYMLQCHIIQPIKNDNH